MSANSASSPSNDLQTEAWSDVNPAFWINRQTMTGRRPLQVARSGDGKAGCNLLRTGDFTGLMAKPRAPAVVGISLTLRALRHHISRATLHDPPNNPTTQCISALADALARRHAPRPAYLPCPDAKFSAKTCRPRDATSGRRRKSVAPSNRYVYRGVLAHLRNLAALISAECCVVISKTARIDNASAVALSPLSEGDYSPRSSTTSMVDFRQHAIATPARRQPHRGLPGHSSSSSDRSQQQNCNWQEPMTTRRHARLISAPSSEQYRINCNRQLSPSHAQ